MHELGRRVKIVKTSNIPSERIVDCPDGGFTSHRILLADDGMGYTLTKTIVYPGKAQRWHYKHHLESCYCVSGGGKLTNESTSETWVIEPDTTYVLDAHEAHTFEATEETVLICVFNPPLTGREVHQDDGSYAPSMEWRSPVYDVRRVPMDQVISNDYNPNRVAPPEMKLLETSIWEDGFTQPVVTFYDESKDKYVVVDGFHRWRTIRDSERIRNREAGFLPIVVINKEIGERMASTIRHNRARGAHNIELMSSIVAELVELGKSDKWICKNIGMSPDELLRLKQITGIAALFSNHNFSSSWNVAEFEHETEEETEVEI